MARGVTLSVEYRERLASQSKRQDARTLATDLTESGMTTFVNFVSSNAHCGCERAHMWRRWSVPRVARGVQAGQRTADGRTSPISVNELGRSTLVKDVRKNAA